MPRPVYIICSKSGALDQFTNLISIFHILEGFEVSVEALAPDSPPTLPKQSGLSDAGPWPTVMINAVWMQTDGDDKYEFEHAIVMRSPGEEEKILTQGQFKFVKGKLFQRFTGGFRKIHPWMEDGVCTIESRVRPLGTEDWLIQGYPIPITVRQKESED